MSNQQNLGLDTLRHSTSHIMADAVKRLFPETKLAIGPSIEDGFYYDFDTSKPFTQEDLVKIEDEMARIIKENSKFEKIELGRAESQEVVKDEPYKLELLAELPDEKITFYKHGSFIDMCRGPHIERAGLVNYYKLLSATGAYWRGSEKNKMLQRIYGTAFFTSEELSAFLFQREEVKKRDHRLLGRELDLFSIHQEAAGPGLIYWHPNGAIIREIIEDFWKTEHRKAGYQFIYSPHIARVNLWKTSGHWDFYKDNMYSPIDVDGQLYLLKPMNCPGHILVYQTKVRSYRELPLRWAELGTVYRYERSGVIQGLLRVRGFTQDDAHIFCKPDQLHQEIMNVIKLGISILRAFGFSDFRIRLATRPPQYVGTKEHWDIATDALRKAIETLNIPYEVAEGEAVFYGPKADIDIKDCLGRAWQCFTCQVDFNLPERFSLDYTADDGTRQKPIMIHRALLGSLERFFAA
ncbi:MAG: threonine--tRNA ligase [Planctomycetota bacterium]|nr:threonine--tRNA ligase [Planctomycetota bacterium]